jgi:membrane protein YdbS with pleckstrin-like domain
MFIRFADKTNTNYHLHEMVILLLAVIVAAAKYKKISISVGKNITVKKGLFCKTELSICRNKGVVAVIEVNPILRVLKVARFKVYTESSGRKPDIDFPVTVKTAEKLKVYFGGRLFITKKRKGAATMALCNSSAISGILIILPVYRVIYDIFINKTGKILPIFGTFGRSVVWIALLGYAVSFAVLTFRNLNFKFSTTKEGFFIESGIFPHRTVFVNNKTVTSKSIIATPLMMIFKRCTVGFSACGYGLSSGETAVLVPAARLHETDKYRQRCSNTVIKPQLRAIGKCFLAPSLYLALTLFCVTVLWRFYPFLHSAFIIITVISAVFTVFSVASRIHILLFGKITVGSKINIKHRKRFGTKELIFGSGDIYLIKIKRTPFDRMFNLCSVKYYLFNKSKDKATLNGISYKVLKAIELLHKYTV